MPLQNRVSPVGELIATPERGLVYGNRGSLHNSEQQIRRHHNGRRWIACRLEFRGRHRPRMMVPGRYTELFFLDEATAFAAGHRPCAECRREDYNAFLEVFATGHPRARGVDAIDAQLHSERLLPGRPVRRRIHRARPLAALPDGTFVLDERDEPLLLLGGELLPWSPGGYRPPLAAAPSRVRLLTPPSFVAALRAGWSPCVPLIHPSAYTASKS
jgi:hypothetical protein